MWLQKMKLAWLDMELKPCAGVTVLACVLLGFAHNNMFCLFKLILVVVNDGINMHGFHGIMAVF
jgi:hypothetical protein